MKRASVRGAALIAAVASTLLLCLTGTANAWYNHGGCEKGGEALGKGATSLNSFDFNVCQRSADIHDVYGDFMAAAPPPGDAVVHPKGPVTCADIKGHEVGFYYPFGPGSFPPPNPGVTGLMIYASDGGATGDKIGFAPVLANANSDCSLTSPTVTAAKTAALPVTSGFITIKDNKVSTSTPADPPLNAPIP